MILHIPHSSTKMIPSVHVPHLEGSINLMTDWYTDELFASDEAANTLVFDHSRLVVDVERFMVDDPMEKHGKGFMYSKDVYGYPIARDSVTEIELYMGHHDRLNNIVSESFSLWPIVTIVDCHSFNDIPLRWEDYSSERPHICIGFSDVRHHDLVSLVAKYFNTNGMSVEFNSPYEGSIMPGMFRDDSNLYSIMIEVNKKLYLDDKYNKNGDFSRIKSIITGALDVINEWEKKEIAKFWNSI